MPRVGPATEAMNAGEFGPRMVNRVAFDKYPNGAEVMENFLPLPQGGMTRRPGTRFVAATASQSVRPRLIAFEVSTIAAYILEAGANTFRFFKHQGQIVVDDTDASITNGDFASGISGWTDASTGAASISHDAANERLNLNGASSAVAVAEQQITIGSGFQSTDHVIRFRVHGAPGDKIKVRVGTTSGGTDVVSDFVAHTGYHLLDFNPGGNASVFLQFRNDVAKTLQIDDVTVLDNEPLQMATPWAEGDLVRLKWAQSADVLYVVRGGTIPIYRLERYGDLRWSLERVLLSDGPWQDAHTTDTTMSASAASGYGVTVTASSTEGVNDDEGFKATDIGRLIRLKSGSKWGWGIIVGHTSSTVVTVDRKGDNAFPTTGTTDWKLGEFSETDGEPGVVSFVQQRLGFASTDNEPQRFWLSQSADIENFAPDDGEEKVEDDDAIDYRFAAKKANTIVWMDYRRTLTIGTVGGEWAAESEGAVLTPADIAVSLQTTHGSTETAQPVNARDQQLFPQRAGRKVLEFLYSFDVDAYRGTDMTVLQDRILKSGIREMDYAGEPDGLVLCLREDGELAILTYQPDQDVIGWSRHVLGGGFSGGKTVIESIACIPGKNGAGQVKDSTARDEVWLVAKRTVNGATVRFIELFEKSFNGDEDVAADAYCFDSLVTYSGAAKSTIDGLSHLEGETVKVWADGALQADKTVSGGVITLDRDASTVQVGLAFRHKYKSLKLAHGAQSGSAVARTKSPERIAIICLETADLSIEAGALENALSIVSLREESNATDVTVPLFTGETELEPIEADWQEDPRIFLEGDHGPCTILGFTFDLATNERM